jgi:membrane-bound lytic murein transglycosylase D
MIHPMKTVKLAQLATLILLLFVSSCATKPAKEAVAPEQKVAAQAAPEEENHPPYFAGAARIKQPHTYRGKTYFLYGAEHLKLDNYYFDIPVVYNKAVKKWIKYFLGRGRGFFARYSARAGRYAPVLGKILEDAGLPRDLIFLAMAESGFQNKAKSWAMAVGPWQFMPYTGKRFGLKIDWYIDERRDPIKATVAAGQYLKMLYEDFRSWELAAAAYNAGEGKVSRAIRRYRTENFWQLRRGRYLKSETKNYVPKIMALAIIGKNLKSFGFEDIDFHEQLDFEQVVVKPGIDLVILAEKSGVPFEEIQRLNPEILRWFTPPNVDSYTLRVPVGTKGDFESCCTDLDLTASNFQKYRLKGKKSNLRDVAKRLRIKDPKVLKWLNPSLSLNGRLKRGSYVTIPFRKGQSRKHNMYADLYERPRKSIRRARSYRKRVRRAMRRGKRIQNPSRYYVVQRGDSLWSVSRKTGTSLDTIIASNYHIIRHRMIRAGDKLVVK